PRAACRGREAEVVSGSAVSAPRADGEAGDFGHERITVAHGGTDQAEQKQQVLQHCRTSCRSTCAVVLADFCTLTTACSWRSTDRVSYLQEVRSKPASALPDSVPLSE